MTVLLAEGRLLTGPTKWSLTHARRLFICTVSVSILAACNSPSPTPAPPPSIIDTAKPADVPAAPVLDAKAEWAQFNEKWESLPTTFKGNAVGKLPSVHKDEFESTAQYEAELKERQPAGYAFLEEKILPPKYDADRQRLVINVSPHIGIAGGPAQSQPWTFYRLVLAERDEPPWITLEYSVNPERARDLREHLGLLWVCRPYVRKTHWDKTGSLFATKMEPFQGETAYETHLRVDSISAIWLIDMSTRAVLYSFRPVPQGIGSKTYDERHGFVTWK